LGPAKVGDARVGAYACAGEGDDVLGPDDPPGDRLDLLLEALLVCHSIACKQAVLVKSAPQKT
jgi:hypothetical protein